MLGHRMDEEIPKSRKVQQHKSELMKLMKANGNMFDLVMIILNHIPLLTPQSEGTSASWQVKEDQYIPFTRIKRNQESRPHVDEDCCTPCAIFSVCHQDKVTLVFGDIRKSTRS